MLSPGAGVATPTSIASQTIANTDNASVMSKRCRQGHKRMPRTSEAELPMPVCGTMGGITRL